jgi:hypothetical protein
MASAVSAWLASEHWRNKVEDGIASEGDRLALIQPKSAGRSQSKNGRLLSPLVRDGFSALSGVKHSNHTAINIDGSRPKASRSHLVPEKSGPAESARSCFSLWNIESARMSNIIQPAQSSSVNIRGRAAK